MRNIQSVFAGYLAKSTQHAIQITGRWGIGKTFMYKKVLEPLARSTPSFNNAKKKYKPIYISLFGLKSIEDIATKIVFEFYESTIFKGYFKDSKNRKALKITESVLKIGLKGFLNFKRLGNANDYLTDIKDIGQNVLDTTELLVCFDDLERKHSALSLEDMIGYINSLVDENVKVLIITNEDKLVDNDKYPSLKEKIINITLAFDLDLEDVIANIRKERYSAFSFYNDFLNDNVKMIVALTRVAQNNLRHLIYALDAFHDCFSMIKKDILDTNNEISEKLKQKLPALAKIFLSYSIEFKSSLLHHEQIKLYKDGFLFFQGLDEDDDNVQSTTGEIKVKKFLKKYEIDPQEYKFFESLFYFATAFKEFDSQSFEVEFKKKYNLEKGKTPIHYQILQELSYSDFAYVSLPDEQYINKTKQVIQFAKEGRYALADYLTIMHYTERADNLFQFDLDKTRDDLIEGFKIALNNMPPESVDYYQFEMSVSERMSDWNQFIYKEGLNLVEQVKEKQMLREREGYINLLLKSPQEFKNKYYLDNTFKFHVSYYPLLNLKAPAEIVEALKRMDSPFLFFVKSVLKDRFVDPEKVKEEIVSIKEIKSLLDEYKSSLVSNGEKIRAYVLGELLSVFEKAIELAEQPDK